jgi:hypothetical protein
MSIDTTPLTVKREGRLLSATTFVFTSYDEPWCTSGIPWTELHDGVVFICGQPEMQLGVGTYNQETGEIKTHFSGIIRLKELATIPQARGLLGIGVGGTHLYPVMPADIHRAIDYTRKPDVSYSDNVGKSQWRSLGELPAPNAEAMAERVRTIQQALAAVYKK